MSFIYNAGGGMDQFKRRSLKRTDFLLLVVSVLLYSNCLAQVPLTAPATENDSIAADARQVPSNKVSLDIKGMDVVDVLKMLSSRYNLNIVIGKNVTGRVTMFLKDVPLDDALELILLANDLAYEKQGDIINVMTQRDYELKYGERYKDNKTARVIQLKYAKAADLSRALNQIKSNVGRIVVDEGSNTLSLIDTPDKLEEMEDFIKKTDLPLKTEVFELNYAQAEKLNAKIQEAVTKGVGSLKMDERTNKIVITDYPDKIEEIKKIVSAFDEKTPQVLIDAQIIEINPSDTFKMGVDWNYIIEKYFAVKFALPVSTAGALFIGTPTNQGAPTTAGQYKAIIDVLRTIGDTKILSSPRIMALNNQEAKILVGTKEAYITSTTTVTETNPITTQTVNFVDVGIKLYVTPTINKDDYVTMKIRPEISSSKTTELIADDKKTEVPIVTTSEAETTVMVKDGVTLIIGGLRKDKKDKTVNKIPILGDIPLVGKLFSSTTDAVTKTELVILLTPHLMTGEKSFTDFGEIKPKEGVIAKMVDNNIVKDKFNDVPYDMPEDESEYYNMIVDKINAFASLERMGGQKGHIKVVFVLSKDGKLIGEPYVSETDNTALVPFVTMAIKDSSPFPPFPRSLKKNTEKFKISLLYE